MNNQKTLLIIDDTETNINTLMELLDDGYDILASLDGEEGLEIVAEEHIDMILLDIMMPGLDGFEVCKRLKSSKITKDIPVIFITANSQESAIEKAYSVGGVDYITKPFKAREVISRINTHLALSEQKHHLEKIVREKTIQLQEKNSRLEEAQRVAKMGSWSLDLVYQLLYLSEEAYNILEMNKNLPGISYEAFLRMIHHEDREEFNKAYKESFTSKKAYDVKHRLLMKDGRVKWVRSQFKTIYDEKGLAIISSATIKDITEEYNSYLLLQEKDRFIEKQAKIAALGDMMDAIAHQWKQPLSAISLELHCLKLEAEIGGGVSIAEIEKAEDSVKNIVKHLSNTIDEFREFFRPNKPKGRYLVKEVMDSILQLEKSYLQAKKVEVSTDIEAELEFACIKTEFVHVIINIINNAIDEFVKNEALERKIHIEAYQEEESVVIELCDNAGGIPEDILPLIFNPNYTTKEDMRGTGVGLYLAKQIMVKIDGTIEAINRNGGACFKVILSK